MKFPRPTLSGILAVLALCLVVSGTAYAAGALPKNSVSAKQIKPNAVRSSDIKNGAVKLQDLHSSVATAFSGPPAAYATGQSTIQFVGGTKQSFDMLEIDQAGDYLITNNLRVFPKVGNPGDNLYCDILGGGQAISIVNHGVDMPAGVAQVTMHGILSDLPAGTVLDFQCRASTNEVTMTHDWTAVQVDLQ